MAESGTQLWFEKTDSGIGVRPASFPGRAVTAFWILLCLLALVTYSTMTIMIFVIIFYTVVFGFIVFVKSDLRPPPPGGGMSGGEPPAE
jgi:hypothetical protein